MIAYPTTLLVKTAADEWSWPSGLIAVRGVYDLRRGQSPRLLWQAYRAGQGPERSVDGRVIYYASAAAAARAVGARVR